LKLGLAVYEKHSFYNAPVMDNIFRDLENVSDDPMANLANAINVAVSGKFYISYLLETATTQLYFSQKYNEGKDGMFRDAIDWLDFVEHIKLGQIKRHNIQNGLLIDDGSEDGKKVNFHTESREIRKAIEEFEVPLLLEDFQSEDSFQEAEQERTLKLNGKVTELEQLKASKVVKAEAEKKFKARLNKIMFEICVELWQVWFGLQNMSEVERAKFITIKDSPILDKNTRNLKTIVDLTDDSQMVDFQELITTYKTVYNTRKTADLPKNAKEAKEKHEQLAYFKSEKGALIIIS
jgi:hypothetical protein